MGGLVADLLGAGCQRCVVGGLVARALLEGRTGGELSVEELLLVTDGSADCLLNELLERVVGGGGRGGWVWDRLIGVTAAATRGTGGVDAASLHTDEGEEGRGWRPVGLVTRSTTEMVTVMRGAAAMGRTLGKTVGGDAAVFVGRRSTVTAVPSPESPPAPTPPLHRLPLYLDETESVAHIADGLDVAGVTKVVVWDLIAVETRSEDRA